MKRDCAFFQLPDDLKIQQEDVSLCESMEMMERSTNKVKLTCEERTRVGDSLILQGEAKVVAMWVVKKVMENRAKLLHFAATRSLQLGKDIRVKMMQGMGLNMSPIFSFPHLLLKSVHKRVLNVGCKEEISLLSRTVVDSFASRDRILTLQWRQRKS